MAARLQVILWYLRGANVGGVFLGPNFYTRGRITGDCRGAAEIVGDLPTLRLSVPYVVRVAHSLSNRT